NTRPPSARRPALPPATFLRTRALVMDWRGNLLGGGVLRADAAMLPGHDGRGRAFGPRERETVESAAASFAWAHPPGPAPGDALGGRGGRRDGLGRPASVGGARVRWGAVPPSPAHAGDAAHRGVHHHGDRI